MDRNYKQTLRSAIDADRPFLKELYFTSLQRTLAAAEISGDQQEKLIEHQFEAQDSSYRNQFPNANFNIVLLDGEPAGRIYIDRHHDDIRLIEMTLLPRFQNQGVGTSLIQELLNEAQQSKLPVLLHVEHWNPDARRLYLRLGFQDDEDIGTHWRMLWEPES